MECVNKVKRKKLYTVFLTHLFLFGVVFAALAGLLWIGFFGLINVGFVRPAYYESAYINEIKEELQKAEDGEDKLLQDVCTFGVYDERGSFLRGTFEGKERETAWEAYEPGTDSVQLGFQTFYRYIEKDNGKMVAVRYHFSARFADPILRKWFPSADALGLALTFVIFVGTLIWSGRRFGKYMKKRLDTVTEAVARIQEENLSFARQYSDVREIDDVLEALNCMKEALQKSLHEQWDAERQKQEQVAALAHDIKTPLTIIRGNAELIQEAEELEEVQEYNGEILEYIRQMEGYLRRLQETLQTGREQKEQEKISASVWAREIERMAVGIAAPSHLKIQMENRLDENEGRIRGKAIEGKTIEITGVLEHYRRAVGNVLSNAAEHSGEDGSIRINIDLAEENGGTFLKTAVADSGEGFSPEALLHATEQFYQGDKSRTKKEHCGMGLYIARIFLEESGGFIRLMNGESGGGVAELYFPCER